MPTAMGFHEGELAVQSRAGLRAEAARLEGMLAPADLDGGAGRFLRDRDFALLTARDRAGQLWISPLTGTPGFLTGEGTTLGVRALPATGDPLRDLRPDQPVGILAIDLASRRRVRVNGVLRATDTAGLTVEVEQAYGNCPQYIHPRRFVGDRASSVVAEEGTKHGSRTEALGPDQSELIERADTFFLGTVHPSRGADASHRGGTPGFVRVAGNSLWWPDYPGNNMFNSLGNLAVDDTAALLFVDFSTGTTLQLSGKAALEWTVPGSAGDDGGTGRRVRFTPHDIVQSASVALVATVTDRRPRDPALSERGAR